MSSLEKKKMKATKAKTSSPNPSLPLDLLLSCIACVSRLYYPNLSLVSKSFRSLLASPELYKTRLSLGKTESCLYVCLHFPDTPNPSWFTLCRKPDKTLTSKKSSGYVLVSLPLPNSPPAYWSNLVAVGSDIYNIGGALEPSSSVWILDCRSHTWREAPSMHVARIYTTANVIDGKIYVVGGCKECDETNWMEVFDPKTQTWELVTSPGAEVCGYSVTKSAVIDGKLYMFGGEMGGLTYKPTEGAWGMVGIMEMDVQWIWFSYGVVDNVLYCYNFGGFTWYDTGMRLWRKLRGLEGLLKIAGYARVKLANYGGKLVVLWDKFYRSSGCKDKRIWCALIALERQDNGAEIWGNVEWYDAVLTVPKSYDFVCAFDATV